jgi:hypothetical protein
VPNADAVRLIDLALWLKFPSGRVRDGHAAHRKAGAVRASRDVAVPVAMHGLAKDEDGGRLDIGPARHIHDNVGIVESVNVS